jgi:hypothetical protein
MKNFFVSILALLCVAALASAEDFSKNGMLLKPGTIDLNAGLGWGWNYGVDVGAGAEYIIDKFDVAKDVPFTFGAAARASLYIENLNDTPLAIGAFGTLHFNWGALKLPSGLYWLKNVDSYVGVGPDLLPSLRLDGICGVSYFFSKNLAVNLEAGIGGSQIGVLYKF